MINAALVSQNQWLSLKEQQKYIERLMNPQWCPVGLTRCRAEYFVRLWAYLWQKHCMALGQTSKSKLQNLDIPQGFISCTHREMAAVFYAHKDRGSDRAAGMILDKLVALGLLDKQFNGNTIELRIRPFSLDMAESRHRDIEFIVNGFNPRTDAILVANCLARDYNWMNHNNNVLPHRIASLLRNWATQYAQYMRVLRRCDTGQPIGLALFHPIAKVSEQNFFRSPKKSVYLTQPKGKDPMQLAQPGDLDCTSVLVRAWTIDAPYFQHAQVAQFLEDSQRTLQQMQQDFPNLCDMYAISIHPSIAQLAQALGFQATFEDPSLRISWLYRALDSFLELDVQAAVTNLNFHQNI
ncbi:MAG: hypothetical protein ACLFV6_06745 [Spirulinaceae cyanobacterium]